VIVNNSIASFFKNKIMKIINEERYKRCKKLNLGCGRLTFPDFMNLDIMPFNDGKNDLVHIVIDIEKERLPYEDNSIEEIKADNVFEHLGNGFIFALNECHRVLKKDGKLIGCVPIAGTDLDFRDITHKRHFTRHSFDYICGTGLARKDRPSHPRYADYGVLPFNLISLETKDNMINFVLSPRKL